ncbi:MAG: hypothetical protein WBG57_07855 [Ornithinimicrobium sp.]
MNPAHHDSAPDDFDADPTGMRDVLASLPDPGPMPDSVTARIEQSLTDERAESSQQTWGGAAGVADLAAQRSRRRPAQWMMAAAAVVAVGVIGTVVFDQVLGSNSGSGDAAAQYAPTQADAEGNEASAESQADAEGDAGSDSDADSLPGEENLAESFEDRVAQDGVAQDRAEGEAADADGGGSDVAASAGEARSFFGEVDDERFATGALVLLQTQVPPSELPADFAGSADRELLRADDAERCVQAIGEDPDEGDWAAVPGSIEGSQVVVVADFTPQRSRGWAVEPDCIDDVGAATLHGPVDLP